MAAALSLAMPKEAFDKFLADTYGIDGLNKLEVADARGAAMASWDGCTPRKKAFPQGSAGIFSSWTTYPSASRGLRPRLTSYLHL